MAAPIPTFQSVQSGHINAGSNTPTGAPLKYSVDNPYCTKDDFVQSKEARGLGITASSDIYGNGELDNVLLRASSYINRYCRHYFDTQTIDEQKTRFTVRPYNPQLLTIVLNNYPYSKINSIYIQVLKWFIQVDASATGYIQDFYAQGFYKIVPLLSSAGTGVGSPIPAAILDRVPLGVLWTNYTFGYGTPITGYALGTADGTATVFQAAQGNRLWAPDQTFNVYVAGVLQLASTYTVDYPNGSITFAVAPANAAAVTADFTTNESIPADVREACILVAAHLMGQGEQNPLGVSSYSIQTFAVTFEEESSVIKRAKEILTPYVRFPLTIL